MGASQSGHSEVVAKLLASNADVNVPNNVSKIFFIDID